MRAHALQRRIPSAWSIPASLFAKIDLLQRDNSLSVKSLTVSARKFRFHLSRAMLSAVIHRGAPYGRG
jgi:hypothetical protein